MSKQTKYFCFTLLSTQPEMVIQIVLTILSVALIGDAIRKFCAMRGSHNSHVTKMYVLVLVWWGTFVASNAYGVVVYLISQDKPSNNEMSTLTKYSFVINWINAYVIQWILLLVPYQWGKQITDLFSHISRVSESQATIENQEYKGVERKMYLTLKCYFYLRILFLGFPIAILIIPNNNQLDIFFKIMIASLLFDCVLITFSLIIGMHSLKTTKQLRQQLDEDQSKRIFNQYLLIIIANTIRFGFDILFVIFNSILTDSFFRTKCPDYDNSNVVTQTIVSAGTIIFSHFLPIFIILRIYNLQEKPEEMCRSLIIASTSKDI